MSHAGFINNILSWKGFLPLGRLTYCVYLIHYDYINLFYSAMRKQYYYTLFGQFTTYFGMLVIVFGLAFGISVCIEASFLNLEKLIFSWKPKSNSSIKLLTGFSQSRCNVINIYRYTTWTNRCTFSY